MRPRLPRVVIAVSTAGGPARASTTKGADICWAGKALGKPPEEGGVYPSEGFG